ncbi:heavy-metal-associated domain-containing protein [Frondihabitans cladoniiphilus]|uniref:HMA domain-containing protein n=1 Tax=Frondihabitans cladoniiphilus TaxID=715785 RepID=A0ABP8WA55_9MICO
MTDDTTSISTSTSATTTPSTTPSTTAATQDFLVEGMTCAHCVASVTEEVSEIPGALAVDVDLQVGGRSRVAVTSDGPLDVEAVREAVTEAGYTLVEV